MRFAPGTPPEVIKAKTEEWLNKQGGGAKPRASAPTPQPKPGALTLRPRATPALPKGLPAGAGVKRTVDGTPSTTPRSMIQSTKTPKMAKGGAVKKAAKKKTAVKKKK